MSKGQIMLSTWRHQFQIGRYRQWLSLLAFLVLASACTSQRTSQEAATAAAPTTAAPATATVGATVAPTTAAPVTAPAAPTTVVESTAPPALLVARIGINAAFAPFVFKDEAGQMVGFDIDLLTAMSKVGNFEVSYIDAPFDTLLPSVESGELDAAISAITVTDDRAARVRFSNIYFRSGAAPVSYYNPGQGLAVRQDETTIASAADLSAGVKVGVKANTTGAHFVATQTAAEAISYAEADTALAALRNGDVDAVVVDIPVIVRYISNRPDVGIRITGGPLTDEQYAIAVNPARPELLERFNGALLQVQAEGTYSQLFEKWFGSP